MATGTESSLSHLATGRLLTMRELQLLVTLASHPQRIMTREELFTEVWGSQPRRDDRSVDVYVSRPRGIGYRFSPDG
jgi:DNA-binding response OmpR family regulator